MLNVLNGFVRANFTKTTVRSQKNQNQATTDTQELAELQYALANEEAQRVRMAQVSLSTMSFNV